MECYRCGATLGRESFCPSCGTDVKVYKKIMQTSNAYYNQALSRAGVRDLSGAVESLKKSLRFNKKKEGKLGKIEKFRLCPRCQKDRCGRPSGGAVSVVGRMISSRNSASSVVLHQSMTDRSKLSPRRETAWAEA